MRLPWRKRRHTSEAVLDESKQALAQAHIWEQRTARLARRTDRAIIQNHFAADLRKEFGR